MVRRLMGGVLCALVLSVGFGPVAHADDPDDPDHPDAASPAVSGPVTGGNGLPIVFSGQPADRLAGSTPCRGRHRRGTRCGMRP